MEGSKCKEKKRKKKKKKKKKREKEEGGEEQKKKKLVEEVPRKDGKSPYGRDERRRERKGRPKARQTPKSETSFGEVWKMALSPFAFWAELAVCQRCSGRTAEKDGDDGKDAAEGGSGESEQMDGGDSTKVEAAKRRRQD